MGLEEIKKEISSAAEQEAATILAAAETEARRIAAEAESEVIAYQNQLLEKSQTEARQIKERGQVSAELLEARQMLALKQELVGQVYAGVLEHLKVLPGEEYEKLLGAALEKIPDLKGTVISAAGRGSEMKKVLGHSSAGHHLKLSDETRESAGGFVISGKIFDIDATFEAALEKLKTVLEKDIMDLLFNEKKS